jgi:hypothetical protein
MATRYRYAPDVEKIAKELIREHHRHLTNVEIKFVFTDKIQKRAGKETWGTARKVGSLAAFLAGQDENDEQATFFVITITEPIWSYLPPEKRRALVDHELCHCWIDLDDEGDHPKLILVGHDLEEFIQVIQRHGLWRDDVQKFVEVGSPLLQNSLFEEATEPGAESSGDRQATQGPLARRGISLGGPPRQ